MSALASDGGVLSVMGGALMISVALVLVGMMALVLTGSLIVWRLYRRVRRWRGWHRGPATFSSRPKMPGPARDVARLRRELREEVEAADAMLSRAKNGRVFIADARAILDDLKINAAAMDADLASIQAYADASQQRSALESVRPQVVRLVQTSYLARQTVLQTEIADRERRLTDLGEHVERQAEALKIYRDGSNGLDLGDPLGDLVGSGDSPLRRPASDAGHPSPSAG